MIDAIEKNPNTNNVAAPNRNPKIFLFLIALMVANAARIAINENIIITPILNTPFA